VREIATTHPASTATPLRIAVTGWSLDHVAFGLATGVIADTSSSTRFAAEQEFTTDPPGFVRRVRVRVATHVTVVGRDRYVDGGASLKMRLLPWSSVQCEFGEFDGICMPVAGEAARHYDSGAIPYIRWRITDVSTDAAALRKGGARSRRRARRAG
jgi:hypothetical protein